VLLTQGGGGSSGSSVPLWLSLYYHKHHLGPLCRALGPFLPDGAPLCTHGDGLRRRVNG